MQASNTSNPTTAGDEGTATPPCAGPPPAQPAGKKANGGQQKTPKQPKQSSNQAQPRQQAPSSKKVDIFLCVGGVFDGRGPFCGSILGIAAAAITPDKHVRGVFHCNLLPLSDSRQNPEVASFLRTKPDVLNTVTVAPVPADEGMRKLLAFCSSLNARLTLIANPIMVVSSFLAHYLNACCPDVTQPPWGYSGVCIKSFCSGVLGVPTKDLASSPQYESLAEGMEINGVPLNDCVVSAVTYANAFRIAMKLPPCPLVWDCPQPPLGNAGLIPTAPSRLSDASTLPFVEYPSITDIVVDAAFEQAAEAESCGCEWVVTEKVHGSNFAISTDGVTIRCSKRTGNLVKQDENAFYFFTRLVGQAEDRILKVHAAVRALVPEATMVMICCEVAGGEYAHPSVTPYVWGKRVQRGVEYAPFNFLYAFDVAYTSGCLATTPLQVHYLNFDVAQKVLREAEFFATECLFRGSLKQCLAFSPIFESTLPGRFRLPKMATPNPAEGVVIRPVQDLWVSEGTERKRVMIKRKHPAFQEFATHPDSRSADQSVPASIDRLAFQLLTPARVEAVCSKYTLVEQEDLIKMEKR